MGPERKGGRMRLECACGRTYRAPDHDCPACGSTLKPLAQDVPRRPVPPGAARIDPEILVLQKLALRDELRVRDRQLRQAELRLRELQAEIDRLRKAGPAPVRVIETVLAPLTLPSDRPDLSLLPLAEELPALHNAIPLPDDRLPIEPE
jgi:hypothetical protein